MSSITKIIDLIKQQIKVMNDDMKLKSKTDSICMNCRNELEQYYKLNEYCDALECTHRKYIHKIIYSGLPDNDVSFEGVKNG